MMPPSPTQQTQSQTQGQSPALSMRPMTPSVDTSGTGKGGIKEERKRREEKRRGEKRIRREEKKIERNRKYEERSEEN